MRNAALISSGGIASRVVKKMNSAKEMRPSPSTSKRVKKAGRACADDVARASAGPPTGAEAPGSPGSEPLRSAALP
jgi:hypothetical protein